MRNKQRKKTLATQTNGWVPFTDTYQLIQPEHKKWVSKPEEKVGFPGQRTNRVNHNEFMPYEKGSIPEARRQRVSIQA